MTRFTLWTIGGVFLGLMIHLVVILNLPGFASHDLWGQIEKLSQPGQIVVLDPVTAGADNPLGLDPLFAEAVCRFDLTQGPGMVAGLLPTGFWSVSVYDSDGIVVYSTTHRASSNNALKLGIFTTSQTRLLAERDIDDKGDMLVVESADTDVFAAIRLAPPHRAQFDRYREVLKSIDCANMRV